MNIRIFGFITLGLFSVLLPAQTLTFPEAVAIAVDRNYGIQIARQDKALAQNNATRENAGFLPTANASAGGNYNLGSSTQKFGNGNENVVRSAGTISGNASVGVDYVLYDKVRNQTLTQLQEFLSLSDLQVRQTVETSVVQLAGIYFEIARLSANLMALRETAEVSNRRLQRVRYQYEYGQGIRLDVLNAEVDVQRDSINLINSDQLLANAKRDLNLIMGRDLNTQFEVDTNIVYLPDLDLSSLEAQALENNVLISLLDKNEDITRLDLELINATRQPVLSANATYTYSLQDNPDGAFITFSNSRGLGLGLNLAWNIFDGGIRKVRTANNRINLETLAIQRQETKQQIIRDVRNGWETYQNALKVLAAEEANLNTNALNLQRTEEQFNLGQVTSVEFRQAQLNLISAQTSYNAAKYDAKIIEVQLLQFAGRIGDIQG